MRLTAPSVRSLIFRVRVARRFDASHPHASAGVVTANALMCSSRAISLAAAVLFSACTGEPLVAAASSAGASAIIVRASEVPRFSDEDALRGLDLALRRQLSAPRQQGMLELDGDQYSPVDLRRSDQRLLQLVGKTQRCLGSASGAAGRTQCMDMFSHAIRQDFVVYRTQSRAYLTAYYTPTLDVAEEPGGTYRYPIYALPRGEQLRRLSRHAIDYEHALQGQGLEVVYARSRFDVYVLHVEGGGRIRIHSKHSPVRTAYLSYAGDNGRELRPIDDYMLANSMLSPQDTSRHAQRLYLRRHPARAEKVYSSNPLYVFFEITHTPPLGSAEVPLTPGRSLASDPRFYPVKGLIAFVDGRAPIRPSGDFALDANPRGLRHRHMQRFFLDQDEGALIEGPGRFDLYFGAGKDAEFLANNFLDYATVYLLVLRKGASE